MAKLSFYDACRLVLKHCKDTYAKSYAKAGLQMADEDMIRCQCLYILSNTNHWRGDLARAAKDVFREASMK